MDCVIVQAANSNPVRLPTSALIQLRRPVRWCVNASSASVPLAHTSRHQKRTSNSCTTKPENRKAKKAPANNYKRPRQRSRLAPVPQPMHAADQSSSKSVNENFTSAARKLSPPSGFRGPRYFHVTLRARKREGPVHAPWGSAILGGIAPSRRADQRTAQT